MTQFVEVRTESWLDIIWFQLVMQMRHGQLLKAVEHGEDSGTEGARRPQWEHCWGPETPFTWHLDHKVRCRHVAVLIFWCRSDSLCCSDAASLKEGCGSATIVSGMMVLGTIWRWFDVAAMLTGWCCNDAAMMLLWCCNDESFSMLWDDAALMIGCCIDDWCFQCCDAVALMIDAALMIDVFRYHHAIFTSSGIFQVFSFSSLFHFLC